MSGAWDTLNTVVNWAGNAGDFVDDIIPAVGGNIGNAGKYLGPAGIALDVASAGMGIANAVDGFQSGKPDEGWNGVGQTANGAIGAGLSAYPPGAAAFAAYSILGDSLGGISGAIQPDTAFNADSMTGGMIRGMFGDESMGADVANALGGGALGWTAGTAMNLLPTTMMVNQADTVAGGIVNWAGNMFDSDDGVRDDYWGQAKSAVGNGVSSAAGAVGRGAMAAGRGIGNGVMAAGRGIGNAASAVGSGIGTAASAIGSGAMAAGRGIGNGVMAAGRGIGTAASAVGSGIAGGARAVGNGIGTAASAVGSGIASAGRGIGNAASAVGSGIGNAASAVASW
jgi:hypothetical protein